MAATARNERPALDRIVDALGSVRALASECGVSTWTARAWLNGTRSPAPESQRRLNTIAQEHGLHLPYPQWESGVQRRGPHERLERVVDRLRLDLTVDERRYGFARVERRSILCVLAQLRPGLVAVKVGTADDAIEYAICDDDLHAIYAPSPDLEDLRGRFPRR
ncbi:MAG TPA: hypothetical protein VF765_11345 [Polyangiaceae bacterium]